MRTKLEERKKVPQNSSYFMICTGKMAHISPNKTWHQHASISEKTSPFHRISNFNASAFFDLRLQAVFGLRHCKRVEWKSHFLLVRWGRGRCAWNQTNHIVVGGRYGRRESTGREDNLGAVNKWWLFRLLFIMKIMWWGRIKLHNLREHNWL